MDVASFPMVLFLPSLMGLVIKTYIHVNRSFKVTEMLIKCGASVNAMDLWQFTPLHEAASKSRVEVNILVLVHRCTKIEYLLFSVLVV